jgi:peptidoglycan/LPS O-acetylase OafA/YrhL
MTAPSDIQSHSRIRYVPALTGMRAIATILVLLLHTNHFLAAGLADVLPFLKRGYLGVDFFFILSGFIITHVYLSSLARPSWKATRIFFWHRFIRLYPVHITVLAALLAMAGLAHLVGFSINNPEMLRVGDLYAHLLLIHGWGVLPAASWNAPAWSISAEWFAYLWFPVLAPMLLMLRSRLSAVLVAFAALVVMTGVLAAADITIEYSFLGPPALLRVTAEFICGAALHRALMLSPVVSRGGADAVGFAAIGGYLVGASIGLPDLALVLLLAITICAGALADGALVRVLGRGPIAWLGEISYSIYMVHVPVLIVCRRLYDVMGYASWSVPGQRAAFFGAMVLVIMVATVMFYAVERPARQRLRDRMGVAEPATALN